MEAAFGVGPGPAPAGPVIGSSAMVADVHGPRLPTDFRGQTPAVRVYPPQLDGYEVFPGRVRNNTSDPTGLKPAASTARSEAALPGDTWA